MLDADLIILGHIGRPHGISGELRIRSYTESVASFERLQKLLIRRPNQSIETYDLISARPHGQMVLLKLKGVTLREQAESLIGSEILVHRSWLPATAQNEYYWTDLIGLQVEDISGRTIGKVKNILPVGPDELLVVAMDSREFLIPFREEMVREVNLIAGRLLVDLPEGLLDL
ncbi:MAG: 16S rRNA processing protein RimM [Deltaproteobacteria bacterium]|nr:16S rRNA processing protein RimM [Deltaproteobacteria bacterium]